MWHDDEDEDEDEFLATRSFFLLVSLSCHMPVPTSGVCVCVDTTRAQDREGGRECGSGRDRERVLLSTNVVIAAQVS